MFIICKSCKKLVDTNKYDFCPRCGSNFNYGDNLTVANHTADYEEYERRMAEQQRTAVENRMKNTKEATRKETQRRLKNQAKQAEGKKNGCSGCIAAVIIGFFCIGCVSGILEDADFDLDGLFGEEYDTTPKVTTEFNIEDYPALTSIPDMLYIESKEEIVTEPEEYDEYEDSYPSYFGIMGDTLVTEQYQISLKNMSYYDVSFLTENDEEKYISFSLLLKNTSGSDRYFSPNISCFWDNGEERTEAVNAGFSALFFPGILEAGATYEASVIFKVPADALYFDITYNDEAMFFTSVWDIEGYDFEWIQE